MFYRTSPSEPELHDTLFRELPLFRLGNCIYLVARELTSSLTLTLFMSVSVTPDS